MSGLRTTKVLFGFLAVLLVLGVFMAPAEAADKDLKGRLEIFSWWTTGGDAVGLGILIDKYKERYPGVEVVNSAVAGGAGTVAKSVVVTRMMGGDPPDTFQVHAGGELIQTWVVANKMEPLTELYKKNGWNKTFPKGILDIITYKGDIWTVPLNIHRSNNLWYNKDVFKKYNLEVPQTWDDFWKVAETLKANGIIPLALGTAAGYELAHDFECVLAGTLGAEAYKGLWNGETKWTDPKVALALENFKRMIGYLNKDHSTMKWNNAMEYVVAGKAGMLIQGDWVNGWMVAQGGYPHIGRGPSPGTADIIVALSDSFGLTKGAPDPENTMAFLDMIGSKEIQEAFNAKKGSIPARMDCDPAVFNPYLQSFMKDWKEHKIVPSVVHGAAASESWATAYKDTVISFAASGDVAAAQKAFQMAADEDLE